MGVWIMSIVGVICLGILLEIVLPEGQTSKYVKGAFSLLIVFVIAAPLPNLLNKDWKLEFDSSQFEVDEEYINSTYALYAEGMENSAEKLLKDSGYDTDVKIIMKDTSPVSLGGVEVIVLNFKQDVADTVIADVKHILSERFKCGEELVCVTVSDKDVI